VFICLYMYEYFCMNRCVCTSVLNINDICIHVYLLICAVMFVIKGDHKRDLWLSFEHRLICI
jgi:hypothetical protein